MLVAIDENAEDDPDEGTDVPAHRIESVGAPAALGGKRVGNDRSTVGRYQSPADPLEHPESDHRGLAPGEGAEQGTDHEDHEPRLVHPYPTEDVAKPADLGREQGDHQQVADDDPDHRTQAGVQRALDVGQRQDHDGRVHGGDQHAGGYHCQRPTGRPALRRSHSGGHEGSAYLVTGTFGPRGPHCRALASDKSAPPRSSGSLAS